MYNDALMIQSTVRQVYNNDNWNKIVTCLEFVTGCPRLYQACLSIYILFS